MVSGHCRKAVPAKATRPRRSALARCIRSSAASLARARRLGAMSSASMLLEVSMATTMSKPRWLISCQSKPHCGRARARMRQTTASTRHPRRIFCRWGEMPTVKRRQQPRLDELGKQALSHAGRPPEERDQGRRNHQQQPEHFGVGEDHVFSPQSRVRSPQSSPRNPRIMRHSTADCGLWTVDSGLRSHGSLLKIGVAQEHFQQQHPQARA